MTSEEIGKRLDREEESLVVEMYTKTGVRLALSYHGWLYRHFGDALELSEKTGKAHWTEKILDPVVHGFILLLDACLSCFSRKKGIS